MNQLNNEEQSIIVYKINPNEQELNGEVSFDRNVDGRILTGDLFICDDNLIVKDQQTIIGIFSLNHFYFIKRQ